jgi:hypothetical protein
MDTVIDRLTTWASEPLDIVDFVMRHTQIIVKILRSLHIRDWELNQEMENIERICEEKND